MTFPESVLKTKVSPVRVAMTPWTLVFSPFDAPYANPTSKKAQQRGTRYHRFPCSLHIKVYPSFLWSDAQAARSQATLRVARTLAEEHTPAINIVSQVLNKTMLTRASFAVTPYRQRPEALFREEASLDLSHVRHNWGIPNGHRVTGLPLLWQRTIAPGVRASTKVAYCWRCSKGWSRMQYGTYLMCDTDSCMAIVRSRKLARKSSGEK